MKKISLIALLLVVVGIIAVQARTLVEPSKKTTSKSFNISNFDELKVAGVYDVEYEQTSGNTWSVEVSAPENIMPYVNVKRSGDCLVLSFEKGLSTRGNYDLKAKIKAPVLKEINLSSASSFKAAKINLPGRKLELDATGASDYEIKSVVASEVEIDLSGASTLKCASVIAQSIEIDASGASDVDLRNIKANDVEVDASGASDVDLAGKAEEVEIDASGASTVKAASLQAVSGKLVASGASDIKSNVANILLQRATGASSIKNKK